MSKAKFDAAKELIKDKQYDAARALLKTIDHPTAREWEMKIDKLSPPLNLPPMRSNAVADWQVANQSDLLARKAAKPLPNRTGAIRVWRNIWGVLTLLSLGWICYGFTISTLAYSDTAAQTSSQAGKAGAAIGASLGITTFLCTGLPLLIIFLYAYSRAGAAIRSERQHREVIEAMSQR